MEIQKLLNQMKDRLEKGLVFPVNLISSAPPDIVRLVKTVEILNEAIESYLDNGDIGCVTLERALKRAVDALEGEE